MMYNKLMTCLESVRKKIDFKPEVALILGYLHKFLCALFDIFHKQTCQARQKDSAHPCEHECQSLSCHFKSSVSGYRFYFNFQISSLYWAIVRSEEKYPAFAIFTSIFLLHALRSS